MNPDRPLDLASMTEDELFDVLGLSDMDAGERLNFLRHTESGNVVATRCDRRCELALTTELTPRPADRRRARLTND